MDIKEMKARWPLFGVVSKRDCIELNTNRGVWTITSGRILTESEKLSLDKTHKYVAKSRELMEKYPYLKIACYEKQISCWIRVGNNDREGFGSLDTEDHKKFEEFNKLAKDVSENPDDFFMCTACRRTLLWKQLDHKKNLDLTRLVGDKESFFKFQSPGADYFCSDCVENNEQVKREYNIYKKLGHSYYD